MKTPRHPGPGPGDHGLTWPPALSPNSEDASEDIRRDAGDLDRGMRLTLLSYIVKFSTPLLLILVIRSYGAAAYGVYAVVAAILNVMMRFCLYGLDKGLLWWLPQQREEDARLGMLPALLIVGASSIALALLTMAVLAPVIARWADHPEAVQSLRWMVIGLVPMTLMELLVQVCVVRRRISAHVIYKEGVVPQAQVLLALGFYAIGRQDVGLELAFTIAWLLGLAGVLHVFRRAYRGTGWSGSRTRPPARLTRYSLGIWVTELLSVSSLDTFLLATFTDPKTVGLYRAAVQISHNVAAVRWSFEPLVLALIAEIGARNQVRRLAEGFSRVVILLLGIQIPLVALLFACTGWIMPLLGAEFVPVIPASFVLDIVYLIHGSLGLVSCIIRGYGRTFLSAADYLISLVVLAGACIVLTPRYGAMGAALSLGAATLALNLIQAVQSRMLVGAWFFTRELLHVVLLGLAAAAVMAAAWTALAGWLGDPVGGFSGGEIGVRLGSLLAFAVVFTPGWLWLRRRSAAPTPA